MDTNGSLTCHGGHQLAVEVMGRFIPMRTGRPAIHDGCAIRFSISCSQGCEITQETRNVVQDRLSPFDFAFTSVSVPQVARVIFDTEKSTGHSLLAIATGSVRDSNAA